jgi:hypothetical protein
MEPSGSLPFSQNPLLAAVLSHINSTNNRRLHTIFKTRFICGPDISVGITTRYGLDDSGIDSR